MRKEKHGGPTDDQRVDQWISEGVSSSLITWIAGKSKELIREGWTNTQMRNFFNEVRRIHELWRKNKDLDSTYRLLLMLRPKLMYLVKRNKNTEKNKFSKQSIFRKLMDKAIETVCENIKPYQSESESASNGKIESPAFYIQNFMDFNEALLAYHYREDKKGK